MSIFSRTISDHPHAGAARGWLDRIIEPRETRKEVALALKMTRDWEDESRGDFKTGVLQT